MRESAPPVVGNDGHHGPKGAAEYQVHEGHGWQVDKIRKEN